MPSWLPNYCFSVDQVSSVMYGTAKGATPLGLFAPRLSPKEQQVEGKLCAFELSSSSSSSREVDEANTVEVSSTS